jgi:small subunit ribosomal protein S4
MARYTGPRVRVARRIGFNVFENRKGDKALQDRPYPPGENGRKRTRETDYGTSSKKSRKLDTCTEFLKNNLETITKKLQECKVLQVKTYFTY